MIIPTFARVGMVGYTGSGKTILANWMALQWLETAGAVFISDPKMDPDSIWRFWGTTVHTGEQVAEAWLDGERIIRLEGIYGEENFSLLEIACQVPRSRTIIDESATLLKSDIKQCPECFQRVVNQGRIHEQGIIVLGQMYTQLPAGFRNQAHIFSANQMEGTGRVWMKERAQSRDSPILNVPEFHWFVSAPDGELMDMEPVDLEPPSEVKQLANPIPANSGAVRLLEVV